MFSQQKKCYRLLEHQSLPLWVACLPLLVLDPVSLYPRFRHRSVRLSSAPPAPCLPLLHSSSTACLPASPPCASILHAPFPCLSAACLLLLVPSRLPCPQLLLRPSYATTARDSPACHEPERRCVGRFGDAADGASATTLPPPPPPPPPPMAPSPRLPWLYAAASASLDSLRS